MAFTSLESLVRLLGNNIWQNSGADSEGRGPGSRETRYEATYSSGNLEKAQGRCVGSDVLRMAFLRTIRVMVREVGPEPRSPPFLNGVVL